ncbi:hypothetical protein HDU97_005878 [Phlyctochytrium planicorne]|nr:hypothetical protein HDU97_005878 [Phlyctochytrium planicorne]
MESRMRAFEVDIILEGLGKVEQTVLASAMESGSRADEMKLSAGHEAYDSATPAAVEREKFGIQLSKKLTSAYFSQIQDIANMPKLPETIHEAYTPPDGLTITNKPLISSQVVREVVEFRHMLGSECRNSLAAYFKRLQPILASCPPLDVFGILIDWVMALTRIPSPTIILLLLRTSISLDRIMPDNWSYLLMPDGSGFERSGASVCTRVLDAVTRKKGGKVPVEVPVEAWNITLGYLFEKGLKEEALNLFRRFPVERDTVTWMILVGGVGRGEIMEVLSAAVESGKVDEKLISRAMTKMSARAAKSMLNVMEEWGVKKDVCIFNCVMGVLYRKGDRTGVFRTYEKLLKAGLMPDRYTVAVLGRCLAEDEVALFPAGNGKLQRVVGWDGLVHAALEAGVELDDFAMEFIPRTEIVDDIHRIE